MLQPVAQAQLPADELPAEVLADQAPQSLEQATEGYAEQAPQLPAQPAQGDLLAEQAPQLARLPAQPAAQAGLPERVSQLQAKTPVQLTQDCRHSSRGSCRHNRLLGPTCWQSMCRSCRPNRC